jgi:hypothetical protein
MWPTSSIATAEPAFTCWTQGPLKQPNALQSVLSSQTPFDVDSFGFRLIMRFVFGPNTKPRARSRDFKGAKQACCGSGSGFRRRASLLRLQFVR